MINLTKKIIAGSMLTMFVVTNMAVSSFAMEDVNPRPILRDGQEYSIKLKGDVNYIKSNDPITLSLRDSDVTQVLRMFADKAGMNIIFHSTVKGNITLDLVDVPLSDAFDMIINISGLNYTVENNTIIIVGSGAKNFNMAKKDMTLIPVKYVNAGALAEFLNNNIFKMNKPGLSNSNIVTINPATNELIIFGSENDVALAKKIVEKFDRKPTSTSFKVNHTTPQEMAGMICKMLMPATGMGADESNSEGEETGGAAGVMTGAASDDSSSSDLSGGSAADIALNSGTVACKVSTKIGNSLPLQNILVSYYPQLGTVGVLGGSDSQIELIRNFISETDKKAPQAYLEVSVIELTEDGSKELTNEWRIFSKVFSGKFDGSATSTNPFYPTFFRGDGYRIVEVEDGKVKTKWSTSKYTNSPIISWSINYLIKNGKARVVVNPRIVITNGVESKIEVTQDYLESVEIDSSTSTGGTVVTREYNIEDDKGITLSIMPFISPDGYVTLNIVPKYSTEIGQIDGQESINNVTQTYKAATLLSHRNLDLKNIRIKDGETLTIAGMIQETENKTVNKIPVLGDLPIVGTIFRSTVTEKQKVEMMILLTPKIITDNDDAVGNLDNLL